MDLFAVHNENRFKMGLDGLWCHELADKTIGGGANRKAIINAWCMEFHPAHLGGKLEKLITFNKRCIERSKNKLAPLTGKERFATLGAGHTTGYCRASRHGTCTTKIARLRNAQGYFDLQPFQDKDSELNAMVTQGWPWPVCVKWEAGEA